MGLANGIFDTSMLITDEAAKSYAGMITRLFPNGQAPLFALTSMLKSETAVQVEHGYYTKTMIFPSTTLGAAVADGAATSFVVVSSAQILPNMVLRAQSTGELVTVDSVTDATHIVVTRGTGQVAAAAIANGVVLYAVGTAFEEASNRPQAQAITPTRIMNLTQIFKNAWALSGTQNATQIIAAAGGSKIAENRMDCAAFHSADIERGIFFGQKFQGTRNGKPFRLMDGLLSVLTQYAPAGNRTTLGATTTFDQLEAAFDVVFNQVTDPSAGNERLLFVGGTARKVINAIGRKTGTYYIVDGQTSFGLQFSSFKISRGQFRMIEHPQFNSNATWAAMGVAVDLSTFALAYMNGRKTKAKDYNLGGEEIDNGIDAVGGSLLTEVTTEIRNPAANSWVTNFTAAA